MPALFVIKCCKNCARDENWSGFRVHRTDVYARAHEEDLDHMPLCQGRVGKKDSIPDRSGDSPLRSSSVALRSCAQLEINNNPDANSAQGHNPTLHVQTASADIVL